MDNKLYCTFVHTTNDVDKVIDRILDEYDIFHNRLFILKILDEEKFIITYNIINPPNNLYLYDTILVHRKKQTNTLYTINALNEVIKYHNDGYLDISFKVNWDLYRNSLLLTKADGFKKMKTRLENIIEIK